MPRRTDAAERGGLLSTESSVLSNSSSLSSTTSAADVQQFKDMLWDTAAASPNVRAAAAAATTAERVLTVTLNGEGKLGLVVDKVSAAPCTIGKVTPGGLAVAAKLQPGWSLLAVNEQDIEEASYADAVAALKAASRPISLTVRRPGTSTAEGVPPQLQRRVLLFAEPEPEFEPEFEPEPEPEFEPEFEPEPEPEPEPELDLELGSPLVKTTTLGVDKYTGQEVTTMYHGTSSRVAQLIAAEQRFKPSTSERSMFGPGIYVTRDKQKAEGYRVHHPGMAGGSSRNPRLPSGEPDPGCILEFRARLGACKEFTRQGPMPGHKSFYSWHDDVVPEKMRTSSMRKSAADTRTEKLTYNSAYTAGCSCCKKHGAGCPGSPKNDHHVPDGVEPCEGRCGAGRGPCKTANSCWEEYCIWNPDRIDHIKIVEGPPELLGYGEKFWDEDADTLQAELAKVDKSQRQERETAEQAAAAAYQRFVKAAMEAAPLMDLAAGLSGSRPLDFQYQELQQLCAAKRFVMATLEPGGGVEVIAEPAFTERHELFGGTYTLLTDPDDTGMDGKIVLGNISSRQAVLHTYPFPRAHPRRPERAGWWLTMEQVKFSNDSWLSVQEDVIGIPYGTKKWKDNTRETTYSITMNKLSAAEVAQRAEAESRQALAAVRKQFALFGASYERLAGFTVQSHPDRAYEGLYRLDEDFLGWPHMVNESGMHCFRHQQLSGWILSKTLGLGDVKDIPGSPRFDALNRPALQRNRDAHAAASARRRAGISDDTVYLLESPDRTTIMPTGDVNLFPVEKGKYTIGTCQVEIALVVESVQGGQAGGPNPHACARGIPQTAAVGSQIVRGRGYDMLMLRQNTQDKENGWKQALVANGETKDVAVKLASGRMLWHVAQPLACWALFFVDTAEISSLQFVLGVGMLIRSTFYAATLAMCGVHNPAFLRVDLRASLRESSDTNDGKIMGGPGFVAMFLFAPDKLAAVVLLSRLGHDDSGIAQKMAFGIAASTLLELSSIAALGAALGATMSDDDSDQQLPSAMIVAHCFPALSLCCTALLVGLTGDSSDGRRETAGFGVAFVVVATLWLLYPLNSMIGFLGSGIILMTGSIADDMLTRGFCADLESPGDAAVGFGCGFLAVFIVFLLVGADVMFTPDGSEEQCSHYFSGFSYEECARDTVPRSAYVAIDIPGNCTGSGFVGIVDIDECRVAVDYLDAELGFGIDDEYQVVGALSMRFRNSGCYSACYDDDTAGYFCNSFNSNSAGVSTDRNDDDHQICRVPPSRRGPMSPP
jgi:hypothetical protein